MNDQTAITCIHCRQILRVPPDSRDRQLRCPHCKREFFLAGGLQVLDISNSKNLNSNEISLSKALLSKDPINGQNWHKEFDPMKFMNKVDIEHLLEQNEVDKECIINNFKTVCIYCKNVSTSGIRLNDRSFLCERCTKTISLISYPEKYEELRRQFIFKKEARRLAWEGFRGRFEHKPERSLLETLGIALLFLMYFDLSFFLLAAFSFAVGSAKNARDRRKTNEWLAKKLQWEQANPDPNPPELKHFHDPSAWLTENDRKILKIFNHWPGIPPFWSYLRSVVISMDSGRCQVTGCPSRLDLHVHHKQPKAEGGPHTPENLVTLCSFHHALEPAMGHAGIWGDIRTLYFTLVCGHERSNRLNNGTHTVQPHLRRLRLVTLKELYELANIYGFRCPNCNGDRIEFTLFADKNVIMAKCPICKQYTEGLQQLTEETGPRLAEILTVSRNLGRWKARWDMLAERKNTDWRAWGQQTTATRRKAHKRRIRP